MDTMTMLHPTATVFDAVSSLVSAAVYVIVALAALAQAPRDPRVRVFLIVALASVAPYGVTALLWGQATLSATVIAAVGVSLMAGSLALLHFAQVFPWRRPWIRRHGRWLTGGYAGVVVLSALAVAAASAFDMSGADGLAAISDPGAAILAIAVLLLAIPVLFVVGIVIPFAGLLSLYKSWLTARASGCSAAHVPLRWMLVSQLGGGVLTILIIPLLRLVAANGALVTIAAAALFGCSLLMPVAFALAIWKFAILDLDIEALPQ